MALTKVARADLFALASTASASVTNGSAVDVSTYYGVDVRIRMGRGTGSAFTASPVFRLEGSAVNGTPNADQWMVLAQFAPALGASIGSQATSGTINSGQATEALAAGTNFAAGDYVFQHNTTLANSEWSRVLSISGSTLTLEENLVNAQTSSTVRNQAEQYHALVDCTSLYRLRVVVDNYGGAQAVIVHADFGAVSGL